MQYTFSRHCVRGICISNLYFCLKDKLFICSIQENNVKRGNVCKTTSENVQKQTFSLQTPALIVLTLFDPE